MLYLLMGTDPTYQQFTTVDELESSDEEPEESREDIEPGSDFKVKIEDDNTDDETREKQTADINDEVNVENYPRSTTF